MGNIKRGIKTAALKLKKHSPEILMVVGCASLVGAVGCAIWKTATCDVILEEHEEGMKKAEQHVKEQFKKIKEEGKDVKDGKIIYSKETAESDIILLQNKQKLKTVGKMAWHFAPVAVLTVVSATSFLGAFCIIKGRYTTVLGALTATTAAFEKYRKRVREDVGEEKDLYYRYGATKEKVSVTGEDGKKTKVEVVASSEEEVLPDGFFTFIFDERSSEYYKDMSTNIISLNGIRATLDMDLQAEGHLTAKDVFKRLKVWDFLTKEQKRKALYFGYFDDGSTHVDFDLYRMDNIEAIKHPDMCGGDFLVLELKGLRPLDVLI